jgi:curved DNA-binding protein CbpA
MKVSTIARRRARTACSKAIQFVMSRRSDPAAWYAVSSRMQPESRFGMLGGMAARPRFDKDYYSTLGVGAEAAEDDIRKAYRRLALRWHPDRNAGDPRAAERFVEISEAYAVLVDPVKRREYDRARQVGSTAGFNHTREDLFRDLFADPRASAIFEELARELERMGMQVDRRYFQQTLFGGRAVVTGGVFIVTPLTPVLGLLRLARAAVRGAQRPIETRPSVPAPPPRGLLGRLVDAGRWLLGSPSPALAPASQDRDLTLRLAVSRGEAERGVRKRLTVEREDGRDELLVSVPSGIRSGTRLRLRGKGHRTRTGPPGDLYLTVVVTD